MPVDPEPHQIVPGAMPAAGNPTSERFDKMYLSRREPSMEEDLSGLEQGRQWLGDDCIDLKTRYTSAWSELNQRISARQVSYLGYAVAIGTYLTVVYGKAAETDKLSVMMLTLSPAIISFAFGCWIRAQDLT